MKKMRQTISSSRRRRGATVVEFALVAPVFLLTIFVSIDFARFWMAEAFVENTVFQTARHISVFGGNVQDAKDFASSELAIIGITEFELDITAFENNTTQSGINDDTTNFELEITVPPEELSLFSKFFEGASMTRNIATETNRPF